MRPAPFGRTVPRALEPVRLGIPLARGAYASVEGAWIEGPRAEPRTAQARVLDRWSDGSVRWVLIDFLADHDGGGTPATYQLHLERAASRSDRDPRVSVAEGGGTIVITAGGTRFELRRGGRCPFSRVAIDDVEVLDTAKSGLFVEDVNGPRTVTILGLDVEERGPIRAVVQLVGRADGASAGGTIDVFGRLHFHAGSPAVRAELTLRNPRRAAHPGGYWELGDSNSMVLRDAAFVLAPPSGAAHVEIAAAVDLDAPLTSVRGPVELFQASSGGANWNCRNHVAADGTVPMKFRGYRLRTAGAESTGLRATPVMVLLAEQVQLAVAVPRFWQNFPKALEVSEAGLALRLFPRQQEGGHELQPGEQKTHVFTLAVGRDPVTEAPLDWARAPLVARATPEQYCGSGAVPYLQPSTVDPHPGYLALVASAIEGEDCFEQKREIVDEYGWRNFGDMYADHERAYYRGPAPIISHYNNQYDALAGLARQFMRSGDDRWWMQLDELAQHVVDIDIYHTAEDKAAYNQGLMWHTTHYVDAGLATHRSYPRAPGVGGGGPAAEHNYNAGLALHYFLTGVPGSRDAAIGLGRWVVEMDDGNRTDLRWLARGDTGVASNTYSPLYHGPGRGAGYSIAALMEAARLSGERPFFDKAEALVRRCIHPADDIEAWELLDIERRWSYTIFLHVLGRYLDEKVERNELDMMYTWARRALIVYARWMAANESPYLDRRAELEFPTETWVVQELWKSEVFTFAARYATPEERSLFLDRAAFFFDYAVEALGREPTRTTTRPMVLLLSRGLMHGYVRCHPEALEAPGGDAHALPGRVPFVPQKVRAKRHAIALAIIGGALAAGGLFWLLI